MADFRLPGPVDGSRQRAILDDGTLMRRASAPPGSLRGGTATQADEFDPWALLRRAACVKEAAERARGRVPAVVLRETGEAIEALIEGLLPGLLMMMAVLGVSVGIGGAAGAAIGALAGGVGALPGAAIGAKAGASVGIWLLTWLGLGFLAVEIGRGLVELGGRCLDAVRIAWDAHGQSDREALIDRAADGLAEAVALLLKLILMAIVARLTMSQAGAAGRSAASSVDEMVAALRQSRLGAGFADWVAANAARLTRNPKLQMHRQVQGTQAVNEASTPSQLKKGADAPEQAAKPASKKALESNPDGTPIGSKPGTAPPGLPEETLSAKGWSDLPGSEAKNFSSVEPVTLKPGTKLYRVVGDENNPAGSYWSESLPSSRGQWRGDLAVKEAWNSNGKYVEYVVPEGPGLNVWSGNTAAQQLAGGRYLPGGAPQVWMPPGSVTPSAPIPTGW